MLSPPRARTTLFDISKKENGTTQQQPQQPQQQSSNGGSGGGSVVHPSINRSNSSQSTYINTATGFEGPGLSHRASFTSIDSSNSSVFSKSQMTNGSKAGSPISTMTSNTMNSVNGPYPMSNTTSSGGHILGETTLSGTEADLLAAHTVEGHVLSSVSRPVPMSLLNCRCGICTRGLASHNEVYRCEGCSLYVHAGCMEELLYPCVPRGFDESGVCWSVLQMWAGLMKGYRSGIIAGAALQQQQLLQQQQQHQVQYQQQQQQQQQQHQQHASPRSYGHSKQLSSSGSEGETSGRDRLSWASFQRWTGRSSTSIASANGVATIATTTTTTTKGANSFSPPNRASTTVESSHHQHHHHQHRQQSAQPLTRTRNGTDSSTHSDTVSFHRDVFMKTIDKDARVSLYACCVAFFDNKGC